MESEAPGWDAIDARLEHFYPGVEPKHFGTLHRFSLGGPDPLDGISFYPRDEPVPHWHVVSYGMSELYARDESDTAETEESGWGFEFSFRIARGADATNRRCGRPTFCRTSPGTCSPAATGSRRATT
jgi:suppressor of fused-like protein